MNKKLYFKPKIASQYCSCQSDWTFFNPTFQTNRWRERRCHWKRRRCEPLQRRSRSLQPGVQGRPGPPPCSLSFPYGVPSWWVFEASKDRAQKSANLPWSKAKPEKVELTEREPKLRDYWGAKFQISYLYSQYLIIQTLLSEWHKNWYWCIWLCFWN